MTISGKSPLRHRLDTMKAAGLVSLIPFLTIGWPDEATFIEVAREAGRQGDALGLRVPHGEGMAHPTMVSQTFREALAGGLDFTRALDLGQRVAEQVEVPVLLETYYNPMLAGGLAQRCEKIAAAGAKAVFIVDLPPEEAFRLEWAASRNELDVIFQCSPSSSPSRIKLVCQHSRGLLYCAGDSDGSWMNVDQQDKAEQLAKFIREVRRNTVLPVVLAMGDGSAEQAHHLGRLADSIVVGDGLLRAVREAPNGGQAVAAARFLSDLREGLDGRT